MAFVYAANYTPNGFASIIGTGEFVWVSGYYILGNSTVAINVANGSANEADLTLANNVITAGFNGVQLDGGDKLTLTTTGTFTTGLKGIYASAGSNTVTIAGTMSTEGIAIDIAGAGNNIAVSGGIFSDSTAININGGSNDLVISGDIQANQSASGILINGMNNAVLISGNVLAASNVGFQSSGITDLNISGDINAREAVKLLGNSNKLNFTGTLYGDLSGFTFNGDDNVAEIGGTSTGNNALLGAFGGDNNLFKISGSMHSVRSAIHIGDGTDNAVVITDSGAVSGGANDIGDPNDVAGAVLFDSVSGEENTLINYGSITAEKNVNTGAVVAVVDAESSASAPGFDQSSSGVLNFYNYGTVHGDIYLGAGNDLYDGAGGIITSISEIYLGGGKDIAFGGSGREEISGGQGNDSIYGGNGDDEIRGDAGKDRLIGSKGDDDLDGGSGNDVLKGNKGSDHLLGGAGDDKLFGGADDDILEGGAGKDTLSGNDGADTFVYNKVGHSANSSEADIIKDFEQGTDLIDLSGLSSNFAFIGSSSFSGAAEVRVGTSGSKSIVRIDKNGDGDADMKIILNGVTGLDAGDFVL